MLVKSITLLAVVAVVAAGVSDRRPNPGTEAVMPYENVDPNTVSCDPEGEVFLLLPGYDNCNKFFMCTHGKEVLFTCPSDLIFDFHIQGCTWSSSGTCTLRTREEEEEEEEVEGSGFDEGDEIIADFGKSEAKPLVAQPEVHFSNILKCSSAEDASRTVPYKGDCQRYWRCIDGVPQTLYCSDGLFFNAATKQCDFEANAKCIVDVNDELQGEYMIFE